MFSRHGCLQLQVIAKDYYNYMAFMGKSWTQRSPQRHKSMLFIREIGKKEKLLAMNSVEHQQYQEDL